MAKVRYGFLIDLRRCIGCNTCSVACKAENDVHIGVWQSWVKQIQKGDYPHVRKSFLPLLCNNCEEPICVTVCPVNANRIEDNGIVSTDPHRCVACRYCMAACPYEVRYVHPIKRIVQKCNWCIHRVEKGLLPACVEACPSGARIFGDLHDPESEIAKLMATQPVQVLKQELGTKPHVFYIGLDVDAVEIKREVHVL
ncbi:MAG TPA: 4Fe-4S dicluster domain-containing protein [bacterium]